MCISDYRIGKRIRAVPSNWDNNAGIGGLYPARPDRIAITFLPRPAIGTATFFATIAIDDIAVAILQAQGPGLHFSVLTHGDLPTHKFQLGVGVTLATAGIIEYFLPNDVLNANIEEFYRELMLWRIQG